MTRITIGPFNRVEGDLEVRLDVESGRVVRAEVTAPLYRGFEQILEGRPPLDALALAPRICGICSVSQSVAAAAALRDAKSIEVAANGLLATNIAHAAENAADHLTHFYIFFMPDFAREAYAAHGWKYLAVDKEGWFYIPFGPPFNVGIPPTSVSQIRRVDPKTGNAEVYALGVRNSVGGDVDPRTGKYWFTENARDWVSDDLPSDKLNMISKLGEHFGYPYCHQGDLPDPKFAMGHKCSEFTPPVLNLGAHVAPLGMKFYTGDQFPAEYKNNILIAEHGSWNRHKYQGGRIMRVIVGPDGKNAKQEVFASGWIEGDQGYLGRPDDIVLAKDGSILVADDWAGAIYRISYSKK